MRARSTVRALALFGLTLVSWPAWAVDWQPWSKDIFARAAASKRLVILDLEAAWCHWCHVMEHETYADPRVTRLLREHFLTARTDQDASPDLAARYGDWGWPATILFASDGTELAKLRGFIPPDRFASLLEAFIADPTPGPSAAKTIEGEPAPSPYLSAAQKRQILADYRESYDTSLGGWGFDQKLIDANSMDYALSHADQDEAMAGMARLTLDAALRLIDPVSGGVYQYSEAGVWTSPHYEKIMSFQAQYLRQYALAYARWHEPAYLDAANNIRRYLVTRLSAPDGAFYTSQDADLSRSVLGRQYYTLDAQSRAALGEPRIDKSTYARETGWAVSALTAYYAVTGDEAVLERARTGARWILEHRSLPGGGFRHGERDAAGPYLGDTLAFAQAALDLYSATGGREWLRQAADAADFIERHFRATSGGYFSSTAHEADGAAFSERFRQFEENIALGRFAALLASYTGAERHRAMAEHVMHMLASESSLAEPRFQIGVALLDEELATEQPHITVAGRKDDRRSRALHAAALGYPAVTKRLDWWDDREGPLPNPDVQYPKLDEPAAYACANRICSLPVTDPALLRQTVGRMMATRTTRPKS